MRIKMINLCFYIEVFKIFMLHYIFQSKKPKIKNIFILISLKIDMQNSILAYFSYKKLINFLLLKISNCQ
ncbi:hypothetical protein A7P95_10410 [Eikenella longinqua]|uniref:Uncharacterized protein n=1 Tax=Eikenella longinqua TaxID=1795827 RepID=A0A1A9RUI4_9NEIS|nr:hypothetical protein A7P95_10410 [Eikenella longinqua]